MMLMSGGAEIRSGIAFNWGLLMLLMGIIVFTLSRVWMSRALIMLLLLFVGPIQLADYASSSPAAVLRTFQEIPVVYLATGWLVIVAYIASVPHTHLPPKVTHLFIAAIIVFQFLAGLLAWARTGERRATMEPTAYSLGAMITSWMASYKVVAYFR